MAESEYDIQQDENRLNVKRYLYKVLVNWPLFIVSLVLAFSVGYLVNRYSEPSYSVDATIMINEDQKGYESLIPIVGRALTRKSVQNEISTLRSFSLIEQTLKELDFIVTYNIIGRVKETKVYRPFFRVDLDTAQQNIAYSPVYLTFLDNNEILVEIDDAERTKRKVRFDEKFESPDFNFTIHKIQSVDLNQTGENKKIQFFFFVNDLTQLTRVYLNKLKVIYDEKKGSMLTLSVSGPIAEQEVIFLNKLTEVYLRNNLQEKNLASINAIKFIDAQLSAITDSLSNTEIRMQAFRINNKIFDILQEESTSSRRLVEFKQQKFQNELKLRYCAYLREYLNKKSDFQDFMAPSVMGVSDPILNSSITKLMDFYTQRRLLSLSVNENNPSLKKLDLNIEIVQKTLTESLNEIENTTRFSSKLSDEAAANEEDKLFSLPPTERQYLTIKREYDINNNIFSFLLQKRAESGIVKASNLSDNKLVDKARVENSVLIKPDKAKIYTTSLILALLIPVLIILAFELLNNKIVDVKEVSKLRKCNMIGTIGHNNRESDIPVFEFPKSALAESFRGLRANLQYLLREKGQKTILITSTISGEGKTFCAINLATILALSNKKTLLMALDMRKPKLHKYINVGNEVGISTYLIHQSKIEGIIVPTNINNLYFAPSGPVPPNPAELLDTEAMGILLDNLKKDFDYIILDTPPVAIVTDALLVSKHADISIYVVRQNFSSNEVLQLIDELAEKKQLGNLNVIVNDVKVPGYYGYSSRYGSRYGYTYHYGYGYGYYAYGNEYYGEDEPERGLKAKLRRWLGT
jgi:tyrosine-protein kinase Etk/Wzc